MARLAIPLSELEPTLRGLTAMVTCAIGQHGGEGPPAWEGGRLLDELPLRTNDAFAMMLPKPGFLRLSYELIIQDGVCHAWAHAGPSKQFGWSGRSYSARLGTVEEVSEHLRANSAPAGPRAEASREDVFEAPAARGC